ncbi:hypothetical protein INT48_009239 [Thamnidium elegans]|uniref:Uncharacterized protein n=1 Tax=Thamnidium elegans TaxID=101142 RepID=A0A8H7VW40_9FUNG|nr:hypothetical protein INT48_009239 [Thamnidium elegans]
MIFNENLERRVVDSNPFNRKFCACMSLRAGCALASIFSFLNRPALIVLGSLSIVFALVSLLILFGLFVDTAVYLESGVLFLFFIVPVYLLDIIANIFIFGIQKPLYMDWCLDRSKGISNEIIMIVSEASTGSVQVDPTNVTSLDTYNCQKLWEDELKFSLAIFITMTICYIYWALCVLHYYQKLRNLLPQQPIYTGFMNYAPTRFIPGYHYNNHPLPSNV